MQLASLVSERFGFKIPGGYVRMSEAGLLLSSSSAPKTKKKASSSSSSSSKSKMKKKAARARATKSGDRARALAATDLQWLSAQEIAARVERQSAAGARVSLGGGRWPSDFVFIPFAERPRSGDEWGWAPSLGEPGAVEPPVLLLSKENDDARIVAPSFATFLFRMTLESLAQCPHDPIEMSLASRVALLRGSARAVLDFLPAELSARLDRVLELPIRKVTVRTLREKKGKFFRTSETTHLSLVGTDWAARIVREELEDPRLDQPLRID
jgi:hypothetical protein